MMTTRFSDKGCDQKTSTKVHIGVEIVVLRKRVIIDLHEGLLCYCQSISSSPPFTLCS